VTGEVDYKRIIGKRSDFRPSVGNRLRLENYFLLFRREAIKKLHRANCAESGSSAVRQSKTIQCPAGDLADFKKASRYRTQLRTERVLYASDQSKARTAARRVSRHILVDGNFVAKNP